MYSNLKRNRIGGINGIIESGDESTLTAEECKLAEAGEWGEIEELSQAEKDVHALSEARAKFKAERAAAVAALTITTEAGNVFDADETSQGRMARAVVAMESGETIQWVLSDNSIVGVDASELKEALKLAGAAQSALWS